MDPNTLFAGGGERGVFRCRNCGLSPEWVNVSLNKGVHPDHHAIEWSGNRLIDGNDGGVWSTGDRGESWQNHNGTLSTIMFTGAALHPTDPDVILAGIRDHSIGLRNQGGRWATAQPRVAGDWGEAEVAFSSQHPDTDWMAAWIWGTIRARWMAARRVFGPTVGSTRPVWRWFRQFENVRPTTTCS
jgi:hypothetical protein